MDNQVKYYIYQFLKSNSKELLCIEVQLPALSSDIGNLGLTLNTIMSSANTVEEIHKEGYRVNLWFKLN